MTRVFCTYFDHRYLPRGIALYQSLRRHVGDFELWVLCLDAPCSRALRQLALPKVRPVELGEIEEATAGLRDARDDRSTLEFYFTCTPALPLYVLGRRREGELVTYVDADLYFFSDPAPAFRELGGRSVAIVGHRFTPDRLHMLEAGVYNVGWLSFRRDGPGLACLRWYLDRCLEWCGDYLSGGRYADQKYLDDWPRRFAGVAVLRHKGVGLASWNLENYALSLRDGRVWVDDDPLIFFHFHGLTFAFDDPVDGAHSIRREHFADPRGPVSVVCREYLEAVEAGRRLVAPLLPEGLSPPLRAGWLPPADAFRP